LHAKGAGVWDMYSNQPDEPDIVLACAGDIATQEIIAAAWLLRRHTPGLKVRVVNVVDLLRLCPPNRHPHGMSDADFVDVFTATAPVVFAFHGYPGVIHGLLHGRAAHDRFPRARLPRGRHHHHAVRHGCAEQDEPPAPLSGCDAYVPDILADGGALIAYCTGILEEHERYIRQHFDDLPVIKDWVWSEQAAA
jgi:xylulose-5-phosphate/fructose-6-phosphate phosphoketolase